MHVHDTMHKTATAAEDIVDMHTITFYNSVEYCPIIVALHA